MHTNTVIWSFHSTHVLRYRYETFYPGCLDTVWLVGFSMHKIY